VTLKEIIDSIQSKVENILQKDKLEHFFIGTLLAFILVLLFNISIIPKLLILIVPIIVALLKESIDKFIRNRDFSLLDILFTIISSIIVFFLI